jgi:hypothetical protein
MPPDLSRVRSTHDSGASNHRSARTRCLQSAYPSAHDKRPAFLTRSRRRRGVAGFRQLSFPGRLTVSGPDWRPQCGQSVSVVGQHDSERRWQLPEPQNTRWLFALPTHITQLRSAYRENSNRTNRCRLHPGLYVARARSWPRRRGGPSVRCPTTPRRCMHRAVQPLQMAQI